MVGMSHPWSSLANWRYKIRFNFRKKLNGAIYNLIGNHIVCAILF